MREIVETQGGYAIIFDFNTRIREDIKGIPGRKWLYLDKYWWIPKSSEKYLNTLRKYGFTIKGKDVPEIFKNFNHKIEEMPELKQDVPLKMELFPFQRKGVQYILDKKRLIVGDQPGLGKAQPLTAKIATPKGWVNMGDIQVGDVVFGSNGKRCFVEAIYPQGVRFIYKVVFNDGCSTECDIEHLWAVRDINRKRRNTGWIVRSTQELIEKGLTWSPTKSRIIGGRKPILKWEVPITKAVNYSRKQYIIHPYIIGMLLGDGSLHTNGRRTTVSISIPDTEIESVNRIISLLPDNLKLKANRHPACPQYYITQTGTTNQNPFRKEINKLGLNVIGKDKFIPEKYLRGSIKQRIQLLQGLMDSDGSAKNNRITFHTCAIGLVNTIVELVQSLGGQAIVRKYDRTRENKSVEWQINIHVDFCPFQIKRKKAQWRKTSHHYARYIKSIEYAGEKECQCIKVSAIDNLYLTDNYIVTHNTAQAIAAVAAANAFPCLVICPSSLKINWQREIEMWTTKKAMILSDSIRSTWTFFYEAGMAQFFITNYESLKKYFVKKINVRTGEDGKKLPVTLRDIEFLAQKINIFKSVIVDESHRVKDLKTQQTKFTRGICRGKEYLLLLTGTPVVNKPKDLVSQLGILDRLNEFGGYKNFVSWFCDADNRWRELNVMLRNKCFYRREKGEVLKELPSKMRQAVICDITTAKEYDDAMNDLQNYLKQYKQATDEQIQRSMRGEIMVRIGVLKNISARGKIDSVVDYVNDVVDSGEKIILFTHLREVQEKLKKHFPAAVTIFGSDDSATRQRNIDTFQNDKNTQIIICSIKAAGVGITLTASSRVAFVELPWHPADCEQAEDRAHRIGQTNSVQCTYFLGRNTIDEWIYKIINEKRDMSNQITGARNDVEEKILDGLIEVLTRKKS
ncbi:MAG: DEAD/DEAH box helicase [Prevotellaceae bacterium]|jgi:hypothetical protein|nr:DEAD/DEAH box helicase [Prevotellaceae bacterium]